MSLRPAATRISRSRGRARSASALVPILVVAAIFGLLLPPALTSLLIGIIAICLVSLVGLVAALGADRASTILLVLAFGFVPLTSFSVGPKPLVLASVLFAIAFGLALPRLIHVPLHLPTMFVVGSLLFTTMGLIATPLAISGSASLGYLLIAVVGLIVIPAAVAWMAPNDRQMFAMALAFGFGTAASTLYGLPQNEYRNAGFTYHPVALAYTAMLTLSFVPFLLSSKVRGRWIVVPPVAAIALVGIWTSGSRTGLVVLIALTVLIPVLERSVKLGMLVIGGIVIGLPFVLSVDPSRDSTTALSRLLGAGGAQGSDSTREGTLRDGWEQVLASPILGNGYSVEETYVIHNIYLQVLAAEGPVGLIGLLLIFAAFVAALRKASAPRRCLAYPALATILAGPFQPNMGDHYLGLTLGLSLVAAVGTMKVQPSQGAPAGSQGLSGSAAPQAML